MSVITQAQIRNSKIELGNSYLYNWSHIGVQEQLTTCFYTIQTISQFAVKDFNEHSLTILSYTTKLSNKVPQFVANLMNNIEIYTQLSSDKMMSLDQTV